MVNHSPPLHIISSASYTDSDNGNGVKIVVMGDGANNYVTRITLHSSWQLQLLIRVYGVDVARVIQSYQ
jgi:hypothetical protein